MKLLAVLIIVLSIAAPYLIWVGLVFLGQILVNAIFATGYAFNVWLMGLLLFIVSLIIKGLIKQ